MTSNSAGLDLQTAVDRFCALEQRAATISPTELDHAALCRLHDFKRTKPAWRCSSTSRNSMRSPDR